MNTANRAYNAVKPVSAIIIIVKINIKNRTPVQDQFAKFIIIHTNEGISQVINMR